MASRFSGPCSRAFAGSRWSESRGTRRIVREGSMSQLLWKGRFGCLELTWSFWPTRPLELAWNYGYFNLVKRRCNGGGVVQADQTRGGNRLLKGFGLMRM